MSDNLTNREKGPQVTSTKKRVSKTTRGESLATVTRPLIRDQVAEQIRELIVSERLQPGDRLPTESELAKKFGVSRLSLREATKALEFLGIVHSKTGVGLIVGELDWQRMTQNLGFHASLHQVDPEELIDSRVIVETGIIPHVIKHCTDYPDWIDTLQMLVDRLKTAKDLQTKIDLDIQFHRALLEASGLAPMIAFGEMLQVFFQKFRDSVKKAEWETAVASHQRIVDALRSRRTTKAVAELKQHIESHRGR